MKRGRINVRKMYPFTLFLVFWFARKCLKRKKKKEKIALTKKKIPSPPFGPLLMQKM